MTEAAPPAGAAPPTEPAPIVLALALDLVTRYRLRLADNRDSRLTGLGSYSLAAAAWTGQRAALVAFYEPPADPTAAGYDLAARCDQARQWGHERLRAQGAQVCDILLVALRPVAGSLATATAVNDPVRLGVAWIDMDSAEAGSLLPVPPGLPPVAELRAKARAVRDGAPVPTLAAVDLAERQTVAGGYVAPVRRQMVSQPYATYGFIALFVLIFLLQKADPALTFVGVAVNSTHVPGLPGLSPLDWWRYVTSAFLHDPGQLLHILFNGLAMLWIGRLVEQLYGRLVLVGAFLITAIVGGILWSVAGAIGVAAPSASLGASGGISGLVGLLLVLGRVQGRDVPVGIARGVRNYALIVIVINALFGFSGFGFGGGAPVNNWVHAGGLVAGALLGLVLPPMRAIGGRDLSVAERVALIAVIVVSVAALVYAAYLLVSPSSGFGVVGP